MADVSNHALVRFQERIALVTLAEARRRIMEHARAIDAAASIGCTSVRLGDGTRLLLQGATVVTVYPPQPRIHSKQTGWGRKFAFRAIRGCKHEDLKGNGYEQMD